MVSDLIQYVIINGAILEKGICGFGKCLGWSVGAICAQACHACLASFVRYQQDKNFAEYVSAGNIDKMRKVVLKTKDLDDFSRILSDLAAKGLDFYLWTEAPENYPSALALKPYPKHQVSLLKNLDLL